MGGHTHCRLITENGCLVDVRFFSYLYCVYMCVPRDIRTIKISYSYEFALWPCPIVTHWCPCDVINEITWYSAVAIALAHLSAQNPASRARDRVWDVRSVCTHSHDVSFWYQLTYLICITSHHLILHGVKKMVVRADLKAAHNQAPPPNNSGSSIWNNRIYRTSPPRYVHIFVSLWYGYIGEDHLN